MTQGQLNLGDISSRAPTLSNESLAPNVVVEQVQRFVDQLLLLNDVLPAGKALADGLELRSAVRAGVVEHDLKVLKTAGDLAHRIRALVRVHVNGV